MMRASALLLALTFAFNLSAGNKFTRFLVRLDSVMEAKYYKVNYDTNYIGRPHFRWVLRSRFNLSGHNFLTHGTYNNMDIEADLKTAYKATMTLGVTYYGITAGFNLNPGKWAGKNRDFEINANFYNNRYSIDLSYHSSKTLKGDFEALRQTREIERGDVRLKVLNLSADYVFNYKRFSMPAAFTQSFIQKKSAGSWLVGISFQAIGIQIDEQPAKQINNMDISMYRVGLGGGYGYNIVAGRWLIHLSAVPTFVVYNYSRFTTDNIDQTRGLSFPDMIFTERAAVTWSITDRYFIHFNGVMSNSLMRKKDIYFTENKWVVRLGFGVRLSNIARKKTIEKWKE